MAIRDHAIHLGVAVLVSWATAALLGWHISVRPPEWRDLESGGAPLHDELGQDLGAKQGYSGWTVKRGIRTGAYWFSSSWYEPDAMWGLGGAWPTNPPEPLMPAWATFSSPKNRKPSRSAEAHDCVVVAGGWPCLAVYGGFRVERFKQNWLLGIPNAERPQPKIHRHCAFVYNTEPIISDINGWWDIAIIPYGVLPLGYVANTIIYWAMIACTLAVYRKWREGKAEPGVGADSR